MELEGQAQNQMKSKEEERALALVEEWKFFDFGGDHALFIQKWEDGSFTVGDYADIIIPIDYETIEEAYAALIEYANAEALMRIAEKLEQTKPDTRK